MTLTLTLFCLQPSFDDESHVPVPHDGHETELFSSLPEPPAKSYFVLTIKSRVEAPSRVEDEVSTFKEGHERFLENIRVLTNLVGKSR